MVVKKYSEILDKFKAEGRQTTRTYSFDSYSLLYVPPRFYDTTLSRLIALLYPLIERRWIERQTLRWARPKSFLFHLVGGGALSSVAWSIRTEMMIFVCLKFPKVLFYLSRIFSCHDARFICCHCLCFFIVL